MDGRILRVFFIAGCLFAAASAAPYSKDDYDRLLTELRELEAEENFQTDEDLTGSNVDLPVPDDLREEETRFQQGPNPNEDAIEGEARSEQDPGYDNFMDNAQISRDEKMPYDSEGFDEDTGYEEDRSFDAPYKNEEFANEEDRNYEVPYNAYENEAMEGQEERGYDVNGYDTAQGYEAPYENEDFEEENGPYERELDDENMANVDTNEFADGYGSDFEAGDNFEAPDMRSEKMDEYEPDDLEDEEIAELARAIVYSIDEEVPETLERVDSRAEEVKEPAGTKKKPPGKKPATKPIRPGKCRWVAKLFSKADKMAACGFNMTKTVLPKAARAFDGYLSEDFEREIGEVEDNAYGTMAEEEEMEDGGEVENEVAAALARSIVDTLDEDFSEDSDGLMRRADEPKKKKLCGRLAKLLADVERQARCRITLTKMPAKLPAKVGK